MSLPRPRRFPLAVAVAATAMALGCSESPTVPPRRQALQPRVSAPPREAAPHPDEYLAKMTDRIPGFAGFYVREGTLVLRVKDSVVDAGRAAAVQQALRADPDARRFRHLTRLLDEGPVQVESSRYDARELWEFRVLASREVFRDGVHRLDLDEVGGVIRLGIASAGDMEEVAARVAAAGIPSDAVVIEVRARSTRQATLRDSLRPVAGGMQIEVDDNGECTLTANAFMTVSEEWGFITASHCTSEFGEAYGEAAYQNTEGQGKVIGWEVLDMELFSTGTQTCPSSEGRLGCRYTDAAFFVYQSSSYPDSMTIARTTTWPNNWTINASYPRFTISGASTEFPYGGLDVHKIGRTTGRTTGEVTDTCEDLEVDNIVTLCSYTADYTDDDGDSGAPVFTWDGSSGAVELVGIHWGGNGSEGHFSPWVFVILEIDGELGEELAIAY